MPSKLDNGEVYAGQVGPDGVHKRDGQRARENFGVLGGCFVDGDAEQRQRERRSKRRSLAISVSLQIVVLAAVVLVPLFGKPERIAMAAYVPIPPYSPYVQAHHAPAGETAPQNRRTCVFCFHHLSPRPELWDRQRVSSGSNLPQDDLVGLEPTPGQIPLGDTRPVPAPTPPPANPKVLHVTTLDPAMLIRRVEPVYPTLARQIRKEGQVQLRAIISTDGSIQSLQYAGGDMMFFLSARDAVLQWRYRPTVLNGQPVEVDTTITVIYTLVH